MKFIDVKSAIIGVLITLLFLSIYGFRPETDELGHLVVKSITVEDDRGVVMGYMGNGYMQTYNTFGDSTLLDGTSKDGVGYSRAYHGEGVESAYVGSGSLGGGDLPTYNNSDRETSALGTVTVYSVRLPIDDHQGVT